MIEWKKRRRVRKWEGGKEGEGSREADGGYSLGSSTTAYPGSFRIATYTEFKKAGRVKGAGEKRGGPQTWRDPTVVLWQGKRDRVQLAWGPLLMGKRKNSGRRGKPPRPSLVWSKQIKYGDRGNCKNPASLIGKKS